MLLFSDGKVCLRTLYLLLLPLVNKCNDTISFSQCNFSREGQIIALDRMTGTVSKYRHQRQFQKYR